jgi:hypothetical protein
MDCVQLCMHIYNIHKQREREREMNSSGVTTDWWFPRHNGSSFWPLFSISIPLQGGLIKQGATITFLSIVLLS